MPRLADARRDREERRGLVVALLCRRARGPGPVSYLCLFALFIFRVRDCVRWGSGNNLGLGFYQLFLSTREDLTPSTALIPMLNR